MAQHHHAGVLVGALGERVGDVLTDATQSFGVAHFSGSHQFAVAITCLGAFGYHHNRVLMAAAITLANFGRHFVQVKADFRNQNRMGIAGNTGVQRNPAGITTHNFDHHDALVTLGRGVQAVKTFGCKPHGGVKPEGGVGLVQVVVDGFGNPYDRHAFLVQGIGDGQRTIAANHHQGVNLMGSAVGQDFV